ncbi:MULTISPECIES: nitrate reductase [unclassified Guyparkeria]|uniref:nitrate reductase n=1 Tax=unclassified Guyparkeria TaxID=2626246 RepID=UPI0007335CF0|nr:MULTISPECIES: nitrate reductase [unclassified Guyparkeria]KTG16191.1 nitrate reductase [Guyparkeria sp. XI15]OAE85042.1 nitrate reductase [Guyparkeria sp. WRN-7]
MHETVKTTCPYCGVGCGVDARLEDGQLVGVTGSQEHPANLGRLCVKGSALHETVDPAGRMLAPQIDGVAVDWDTALDTVASGFRTVIEEHGPDAVAMYVSGQLLTEDYYVANKLMKGFIGTANIDTNSRLCMASAVVGYKRAFGTDTVPTCYEDIELADLVVLVGSNAAWTHPVTYQRLVAAKRARPEMRVVVIDPRRTATADIADLHLAIEPGSDAFLFNGLLAALADRAAIDRDYVEAHTEGFDQAIAAARGEAPDIETVARTTGLGLDELQTFFDWFVRHQRTVTVYSQGVNQSTSGSDKANAIINCHLATGRIGVPGMGPFSITGQPNAMGGREVGGLANQLAAHMDFEQPGAVERVGRFWGSPGMATSPGLKATDLFEAVESGRIKAIWIMATNPVVSLPDADRVREALRRCPLVVVSDCMQDTDTTACADVLLPATSWAEKDGTVTNSERCISRQRGFLEPPGQARHDWWTITEVARRLGFTEAFPYRGPADIFREHAALSGYENDGSRDFDIHALARLSDAEYDQLDPVRWPIDPATGRGRERLFENGRFFTPSGRARFVAITSTAPASRVSDERPLVMNTGRIRDQWHTMTRTAKAARLMQHIDEPFLEIHPDDADRFGLTDGRLAEISGEHGRYVGRVRLSTGQKPGSLFVPMHWNGQYSHTGRVGALIPAHVDPFSGQPESKHATVAVRPFDAAWFATLLSREPIAWPTADGKADHMADYWARIPVDGGVRYEIAGREPVADWSQWARHLLGADGEWQAYEDSAGPFRAARLVDGRVAAVLFVATDPDLPSREWLAELIRTDELSLTQRLGLLAGRPAEPMPDTGPIVCSCFQVGETTVLEAIDADGLDTPEALGKALRCGTNCGSCIPELKQLIAQRLTETST